MHREIQFLDRPFQAESRLGLHLLTALVAGLVLLEVWPYVASWLPLLTGWTPPLPALGLSWGDRVFSWALIAALIGGARALYTSAESLLAGRFGADLALAVAIVAALLINQPLVAAEIILIGLVGECLEAYTFGRTQAAVRKLVETCPRMCLVIREGQEQKIPVDEVQPGERIVVLPGKRVPVDGAVVEGRSAVDQSYLTGESLPVDKEDGDSIWAGTLNQFGRLVVEVQRVASQTVMGRVIELTSQALQKKSAHARLVDRLARWFLPAVALMALATYVAHWIGFSRAGTESAALQAVYPALAVLVVACPCALILATPATLMAAVARLARTGVLLKHGRAMEALAQVDAIAFDKTGTLTEGRPHLGSVVALGGASAQWADPTQEVQAWPRGTDGDDALGPADILRWAAAAEIGSEHPLGQVVVTAARDRQLPLSDAVDFHAHPGGGVAALVAGQGVLVGNQRLLASQQVEWNTAADEVLARIDALGQTALLVAVEGRLVGLIGVWDVVRPEAASVLQELRQDGLDRQALLTGDRWAAARAVAERLGVAEVQAELTPPQKVDYLKGWQAAGRRVAMIGDGVNDAPALAQADVGLALGGTGADIAAEAGDIVFMGDPLRPLPLLVRLARQMDVILRQNLLIFAVGVNVVGVVLTAWILPLWSEEARRQAPLWAAVYHQIGSLGVLINAMRLLWFEKSKEAGWWRGLAGLSAGLDAWIERLDPHELSHRLGERAKTTTAVALVLMLLLWAAFGLTQIPEGSVGVVQRMGQTLPADLPPGLHWRWPWPLERVHVVDMDRLRPVGLGFRLIGGPDSGSTWATLHPGVAAREREEALMITGDGNLLEVQLTLWYRLADARAALFATADPEPLLRGLGESVVREALAGHNFIAVLSEGRGDFERLILGRLRERLAEPAYARLGLDLHSVAFQDFHPPREVLEAYYQVTRALARRSQTETAAEIERDNRVARENMARERLLAQAQGRADDLRRRSQAEVTAFVQFAVAHHIAGAVSQSALGPLSEFRLTVEAAETVFAGRPKVLRDPALPGQVHIMPDVFRLRLPPLSRERTAPPEER
ncbi:MAG TPA: heavy metal translocating P-type ATPase [Gemmatales bacterium]|nr:heavy metal translocating P-type ATPase [Gemmatales bacterium]